MKVMRNRSGFAWSMSWCVVLCFVCVQMLSFLHMVEHHFEAHEHGEKPCSIYLHCDKTSYSAVTHACVIDDIEYSAYMSRVVVPMKVRSDIYIAAAPRAPPTFF